MYKSIKPAPLVQTIKQDRAHTPDINNWQGKKKQLPNNSNNHKSFFMNKSGTIGRKSMEFCIVFDRI